MFEKTTASAKNFVVRHKTALTVVATATVCYVIHHTAIKQHNEFLEQHGLTEAFYHPEMIDHGL